MKLKNLNGWQRLWVVLSAAWFVVVVVLAIANSFIPTTSQLWAQLQDDTELIQRDRVNATINALRNLRDMRNKTDTQIRLEYRDLSDTEFVAWVHSEYPNADLSAIESNYQRRLEAANTKHREQLAAKLPAQIEGIGFLLLLWLVPSVGVYLLAWGGWRVVLWVWRGFKLKGESQ